MCRPSEIRNPNSEIPIPNSEIPTANGCPRGQLPMDGQLGRIFRFVDALQSILPMRPVGGAFVELVFATALEGLEVRKTKATDGIICLFVLVQRQQMREHQLLCLSLYFARQAGACGRDRKSVV